MQAVKSAQLFHMKRTFIAILCLLAHVGTHAANATATPPNIVVILTDDQGYADISFNPRHPRVVATPHMDALAREGIFFSQGYSSGNVHDECR